MAVAAIARKLTVAIWYLLMGRWTPLEEIDPPIALKITKIVGAVGRPTLQRLGLQPKTYRQKIYQTLKESHVYLLHPNK